MYFTDKAIASMHCPSIVRLTEGENFFCLCEDISTSEVTAQASWLVDGQTFKHSRRFHEEELYLNNVTAADAGFYTCRVRTVTMVDDITLEVLVLHGMFPVLLISFFPYFQQNCQFYRILVHIVTSVLMGTVKPRI